MKVSQSNTESKKFQIPMVVTDEVTIFSTLAEADLVPVKVELMEPSLESLFLEVIK